MDPGDESKLKRTTEYGHIKESAGLMIDVDAVNIREARFILPAFTMHAVSYIMRSQHRDIPVNERYKKIEQKFSTKYHLMVAIPLLYKYVVFRLCLEAYG